jgi:hypothetical protein
VLRRLERWRWVVPADSVVLSRGSSRPLTQPGKNRMRHVYVYLLSLLVICSCDSPERNDIPNMSADSDPPHGERPPIASASEPAQDLTVAEVNDIVRQIMIDDSLDFRVLCARPATLRLDEGDTIAGGSRPAIKELPYMSAFSPDEIPFVVRQNRILRDWTVRDIGLKYYDRTDSGFVLVEITDSCSSEVRSVNYINVPLVSPDRSRVILGYGAVPHYLSGWGVRVLYIKENGRWVKKKEYGRWIS